MACSVLPAISVLVPERLQCTQVGIYTVQPSSYGHSLSFGRLGFSCGRYTFEISQNESGNAYYSP